MRSPLLLTLLALAAPAQPVDFARDVQPLFREHCFSCHGPKVQSARFRLDRRRDAFRGGNIAVIAPGTADGSRLFHKITSTKYGPQMPPAGPLSAENISIIRRWLDQGAPWPDDLANDAPALPADPAANRLMDALRAGKPLRPTPAAAKAIGRDGNTPLHFAALYGTPADIRLLLDAGADPNVANEAGVTPLMWAVANPESVKTLLDAGAKPNARSLDGQTAFSIAAGRAGSAEIVRLLLAKGADPKASTRASVTDAAATADPALLRAVLVAIPKPSPTSLAAAIRVRCQPCADVLLPLAAKPDLDRALLGASHTIDPPMLASLLEKGASLGPMGDNADTPLHGIADVETAPAALVAELLRRGASPAAKNKVGKTPLDLALRHGQTPVVKLLAPTAAPAAPNLAKPAPAASPRAAFDRALPLLRKTDAIFLQKSGCVSCHHNSLFAMTLDAARASGLPVDSQPLAEHRRAIGQYIHSWRERAATNLGIPGGVDTISYLLLGLAAAGYPADEATDAFAYYIKGRQRPDGSWAMVSQRPPIESSDLEVTAASLRALQVYAPAPHRAAYRQAVDAAARYLASATPVTNEDSAFQILGLHWAGRPAKPQAAALLARQNADGGWSQTRWLASDAYATGQALYALRLSGALKPSHPAYQRGVKFLMQTQAADGSWFVASRSNPFQPYFETGFPYGDHQWISTAASNWAAMALAYK